MTRPCRCPLVLLVTAVAAVAAVAGRVTLLQTTVKDNIVVNSHSFSSLVPTACRCWMICFVQPNCTAAVYDPSAFQCNTTESSPEHVTLQPLTGAVAFLKFEWTPLDPCSPRFSAGHIFVTRRDTQNSTAENLQQMCHDENGEPLLIKTEEQKTTAVAVLKDSKVSKAWLTATYSFTAEEMAWPDGTLPSKLLLLQLFAAALVPAAAVYQTVIKDTAIYSPISKRMDVMTECEVPATVIELLKTMTIHTLEIHPL
ncbi:hypothetical protein FHG87_008948 [Trinorchestia longiramus]|nr:hypothetical protein FHG87_008948 [Trinorchestia longiramus]